MSNFSNIGFSVISESDLEQLINGLIPLSQIINVINGKYIAYSDNSGAQLWIQVDKKRNIVGANPHYDGKSRITVCLTSAVKGHFSELDGSFHCWASPEEEDNPDSGVTPLFFDAPDFSAIGPINFPKNYELQLTAFAQEIELFASEEEFGESQTTEMKFATISFFSTGLFNTDDDTPAEPTVVFTGIIKDFAKKKNNHTNTEFYWLLVETLCGEVDIVADINFFNKEPIIGGIATGSFYLSAKILNAPEVIVKKNFFQKLFGN